MNKANTGSSLCRIEAWILTGNRYLPSHFGVPNSTLCQVVLLLKRNLKYICILLRCSSYIASCLQVVY